MITKKQQSLSVNGIPNRLFRSLVLGYYKWTINWFSSWFYKFTKNINNPLTISIKNRT